MGFNAAQEENIAAYGGYGGGFGGGGAWSMIILVVVVLWLLFRDGHKDGIAPAYGYGGGCGPCVQPTFKDESNWEQEYHLCKEIGNVDKDVWKTACETQKEVHCEGEKTRALIEANYIQDLRDRLAEKNSEVMTLKQEMFTEKKFDQLNAQFCKTDAMIAALSCELPKRPPVFAECVTPNTHDIDCDDRRFRPRRGRCDFDDCFAA